MTIPVAQVIQTQIIRGCTCMKSENSRTSPKWPHIKNLENIGPSLQHRVKFRHLIQNADLVNCLERALVADHK